MTISLNQPGYFAADAVGDETADFYREQGYCVVHGAVSQAERGELLAETVAICRGRRGPLHQSGWGTPPENLPTPEQCRTLSDDEILTRFLCIHHPHKFSEVMHRFLAHPVIVDVLTRGIGPDVKCMQSMLFIKSAGKPGQAWHQDEDYIPTRDRTLAGAWIALDDAVVDNGCLWLIPGSHRPGVLWPQYPHDDPRFDCAREAYDFPFSDGDAIAAEVPAGSIVFFNGYLLHRSLPNRRTTGYRRTLVNHYMSARSLLPWHVEPGQPVATADYRDIVMVAGQDPYAYKGTADIATPHVRPAGQGGCGDGRVDLATWKSRQTAGATP